MTYREIYNNALRLAAESDSLGDTSDYEERAAYILASFCSICLPIDSKYRLANKISKNSAVISTYVALSDSFPLVDVFAAPASYYLAAMLVLDENEDMSERLFAEYTDAIASIQKDLPTQLKPITDRYGCI